MKSNHFESVVLLLFAVTEVFSQRTCYRGFTGEDSGGSCSFSQSLCNWTSQGNNNQDWKLNKYNSHVQFNTQLKENEESAWLISPLMCEMPNTTMCLKFQFKMISNDQRTLTLTLKCGESNCKDSLIWSRHNWTRGSWEGQCIDFQFPKTFNIVFEAKKSKGFHGTNADFSIDNITYHNTKCSVSSISTVKTENIPATSSSYFTFKRHSTTTDESSTFTNNLPSTALTTNAPGTSVAEVHTTHGKTTTSFYNNNSFMTTPSVSYGVMKADTVDHTLVIVLGSLAIGLGAAVLIIVIAFRIRRRPGTHSSPDNQRAGTTIMIMNEIYVST